MTHSEEEIYINYLKQKMNIFNKLQCDTWRNQTEKYRGSDIGFVGKLKIK